jgi:hypothetical protein
MASTVFLIFLWSSDASGVTNDIYFATFDRIIHPCSSFASILGDLSPSSCSIMPYIVGPTVFFSISMLASPAFFMKHSS